MLTNESTAEDELRERCIKVCFLEQNMLLLNCFCLNFPPEESRIVIGEKKISTTHPGRRVSRAVEINRAVADRPSACGV